MLFFFFSPVVKKSDFDHPFFASYFSMMKADDMECDTETLSNMRWILMKPGVLEESEKVRFYKNSNYKIVIEISKLGSKNFLLTKASFERMNADNYFLVYIVLGRYKLNLG